MNTLKMPSRMDRSILARWWWSVDHINLGIIAMIILIGMVLIMAAGPVAAARLSIPNDFHFAARQFVFLLPAIVLMVGASLLTPLQIRRFGVIVFLLSLASMVALLMFGGEVNGAKRWLDLGPAGFQPSEFAKTGFVIAAAWMLAEGARDPKFPGGAIALGLYGLMSVLLILQPDIGQWILLTGVWGVMVFIAGWSLLWLFGLAAVGAGTLVLGYYSLDHVRKRIDGFLHPEVGDNYQVDRAVEAIAHGGPVGQGSAEALIKHKLPDAHTDFIFAVAAEEYGFILGATIITLFVIFVARAFLRAFSLRSVFAQVAVCGLAAMMGFQAFINIGVSLRALPAKGMTLPFISYGGSSLIATGLAVGFLFALTRTQGTVFRRREIMP